MTSGSPHSVGGVLLRIHLGAMDSEQYGRKQIKANTLCEPAQSKCIWTSHKELLRELAQSKRAPHTRTLNEPRLYSYPKNLSVWTLFGASGKLQIHRLTLSKTNTENPPSTLLIDGQYAIDVQQNTLLPSCSLRQYGVT